MYSGFMKIHTLNSDGTRSEDQIEHEIRDEDQLLGVLVKMKVIADIGYIGYFLAAELPTKIAAIKVEPLNWMKPGTLVRFSQNEYKEKTEYANGVMFSTASLTYLDETPFYRNFEIGGNRKFQCDVCNFQVIKIQKGGPQKGCAKFPHPIFGDICFNLWEIELRSQVYDMLTLESVHDAENYGKLKFLVKSQTDAPQDGEPTNQICSELNEPIIDVSDTDTVYGVVWLYHVRTSTKSVFDIFCAGLSPKNCATLKMPCDPNIPIGSLVKFSKSEYFEKRVQLPSFGWVSTPVFTYFPNHKLYDIEVRIDNRHVISLKNYTISTCLDKEEHVEFEHSIFGIIEDRAKLIRVGRYKKIELRVIKRKNNLFGMKFVAERICEAPIITAAEREFRSLSIEERGRRLPELLKIQIETMMEGERRKWGSIGTLVYQKMVNLGGIEGNSPYFQTERSTPLSKSILDNKLVSVYLKKIDDESEEEQSLPFGMVKRVHQGFAVVLGRQHRYMIFEQGDKYQFIPKVVEKSCYGKDSDEDSD